MKNYRIIYKPHVFAMKRIFKWKDNFDSPNKVIFFHKIKEFNLEDYPYLLKSMEGIITPYSTVVSLCITKYLVWPLVIPKKISMVLIGAHTL